MSVATTVGFLVTRALQRRVRRVRFGQKRIPTDAGTAAGCQGSVSDGTHTSTTGAHRSAAVTAHTATTHRRHSHRWTHGAHVEATGTLRAAARPDPDAHRHAHRHAAHRVDGAICRRHTAHAGHRGAAHGTRIAVQFLRLEHGHRAHRCRGGLLSRRRCQTAVMKSAVPRLLTVGYSLNLFTGRVRTTSWVVRAFNGNQVVFYRSRLPVESRVTEIPEVVCTERTEDAR